MLRISSLLISFETLEAKWEKETKQSKNKKKVLHKRGFRCWRLPTLKYVVYIIQKPYLKALEPLTMLFPDFFQKLQKIKRTWLPSRNICDEEKSLQTGLSLCHIHTEDNKKGQKSESGFQLLCKICSALCCSAEALRAFSLTSAAVDSSSP